MLTRRFRSPIRGGLVFAALAVCAAAPPPANAAATSESFAAAASVTSADRAAAAAVRAFNVHVMPARTMAGALAAARTRFASGVKAATATQGFYPADLTFFGGPVLKTSTQNNVYVNEPNGATWGDPATFEQHLSRSNYIHVTDQYVGTTANDRYPVGTSLSLSLTIYAPLYDQDVIALVHAAATKLNAKGLGHTVHLFFPPGVDICTAGGACYSPDNLATFFFCAYHTSLNFPDIGLVLASVEPYQPVPGCGVDHFHIVPVNSELIDGTASVLSHEIIETITDPTPWGVGDPRSGWVAASSFDEYNFEIADECDAPFVPTNVFDSHKYTTQLEYSNKYHACVNGP